VYDNIDSMNKNREILEKEYKELQTEIQKKFSEQGFQMKSIEGQLTKLSEFENKIKENSQITNDLTLAKEDLEKRLKEQSEKIEQLEENLNEKIEDLEEQCKFLATQKDDFFINKFHEVEKQLSSLIIADKNRAKDVDFSTPISWSPQNDYLSEVLLSNTSKEFIEIRDIFNKTLNNKVLKIWRIQNTYLWKNYCLSKYQLSQKGNCTELMLFHGTKTTDPKLIYSAKEEGFDMRFANMGLHGTGIYFHKNSKYSNDYCYVTNTHTRMMFCAHVLIGDCVTLPIDRNLRLPPIKINSKIRYDSVKSNVDEIYIIYNNLRAYPTYLIEYQ
jgi:hypothetical protein